MGPAKNAGSSALEAYGRLKRQWNKLWQWLNLASNRGADRHGR
jgi:hypothetical protein